MLKEVDEQYEHQKMFWMIKKNFFFYSVEKTGSIRSVKVSWNETFKKKGMSGQELKSKK